MGNRLLVGELVFYVPMGHSSRWNRRSDNDYGVVIDDGMANLDNYTGPTDEKIGMVAKRPVVLFFDRDFGTEDVSLYGALDQHTHPGAMLGRTDRLVNPRAIDTLIKAWNRFTDENVVYSVNPIRSLKVKPWSARGTTAIRRS